MRRPFLNCLSEIPVTVATSGVAPRLLVAVAALLTGWMSTGSTRAQGFPEPSVVLYGKVVQITTGSSSQLFEGTLQVTFVNEQNPANIVTLQTSLDRVGEGGAFSYALDIPQKYLPRPLELDEVLSTGSRPTRFRLDRLAVRGFPALPLPGAAESITTSFQQRAQQIRLDLRVTLPEADSDGDGLPDWWETQSGLNPNFPDANADQDGDGRGNLQEFREGTDPSRSNTSPLLRTARVLVPERGRAGLLLNLLDSDSTPAQLTVRFKSLTPGFALQRGGSTVASNATFTLANVASGQLVLLHHDATRSGGTLAIEIQDQNHPATPATLEVLVFKPSLADGTEASLWLDAYQTGAADKARLAEWRDRSGSNHHAWQPSTNLRPVFAAGADGKPAVDFAGSQRHLLFEDKALPPKDATVFAVYDTPRTGDTETVFAANRLTLTVEKHGGKVSYPGAQTFTKGNLQVSGRYNVRDLRVVSSVEFSGSQGAAFANERFDGLAQPAATLPAPVEPALGLQRRLTAGEPERFGNDFEGKIRELIAFPTRLDPARRRRITDYLESKWRNATLWDWSDEASPVSVQGGATRNIIRGGWGADLLRGGAAEDLIAGGPGDDTLSGGGGSDTFSYTASDTGRDLIQDFGSESSDHDVLDLSEFFAGKHGDARDYLHLRTEAVRVGENLVVSTLLSLQLDPSASQPQLEISLQGIALNDSDLGRLIGEHVILTGSLVIPVTVTLEDATSGYSPTATQAGVRVTREGNTGAILEVPLALLGPDDASPNFTLAGLAGDGTRQVVRFERGETVKTVPVIARAGSSALANHRARVEILPQVQYLIGQGSVEVVLEGDATTTDGATDAYAAWAAGLFPPGTDPSRTARTGDYDGDGAGNLSEYAFGTDPTRTDSRPGALGISQTGGRLTLTLVLAADIGPVRCAILHRPSLATSESEVTESFDHSQVEAAPGLIQHRFTSRSAIATSVPLGFYRAQVILPERN